MLRLIKSLTPEQMKQLVTECKDIKSFITINEKNNYNVVWLSNARAFRRFLFAGFNKRDFFNINLNLAIYSVLSNYFQLAALPLYVKNILTRM